MECGQERRYFPKKDNRYKMGTRKKWEKSVTLNQKKVTKSNEMEAVIRIFRITAGLIAWPSHSNLEEVLRLVQIAAFFNALMMSWSKVRTLAIPAVLRSKVSSSM